MTTTFVRLSSLNPTLHLRRLRKPAFASTPGGESIWTTQIPPTQRGPSPAGSATPGASLPQLSAHRGRQGPHHETHRRLSLQFWGSQCPKKTPPLYLAYCHCVLVRHEPVRRLPCRGISRGSYNLRHWCPFRDSGASSSMTGRRSAFFAFKPDRRPVRLADGLVIFSEGLGSIRFLSSCGYTIVTQTFSTFRVSRSACSRSISLLGSTRARTSKSWSIRRGGGSTATQVLSSSLRRFMVTTLQM